MDSVAIMKRLRKHGSFLHYVTTAPAKSRKIALKNASSGELCSVCEVSKNLIKGNIPVSPCQKKKLSKYKALLRTLANRRVKLETKRRLLQQGGAILPLLAPLIIPLISSLIGRK